MFTDGDAWAKTDNGIFGVTMVAYNGAEVCKLVEIYLLSVLSNKCNKECIGLYRDDGLAGFKSVSGPQSEKIKKYFQKVF